MRVSGAGSAVRAAALMLAFVGAAPAGPPAEPLGGGFSMGYRLLIDGRDAGRLARRLQGVDGNEWQLDSRLDVVRSIPIIGGDYHAESTRFALRRGRVLPISYREERAGTRTYLHDARFDWRRKRIDYADGRAWRLDREYIDANALIVQLMLRPAQDLEGDEIEIVTGRGVRRHRFGPSTIEVIATPLGRIATWRVRLREVARPDRGRWLWFAPDHGNALVRVAETRAGRRFELVIDEIVWGEP